MSVLDIGCFDGFYAVLAERRGGPRRSWRWTTSSIGCGSLPGGALSWRAGRASEPFIDCSARRLSIDGGTRSRSTGSRRASTWCAASAFCIGSRIHSGCCACCVGGRWMAARCWSRPTASVRKIERARRSASPSPGGFTRATSSSTGGSGTPACSGLPGLSVLARRVARRCGGRRRPAHHRSAGRLEAPGRRSQQPLHKTTISGRYCRSGFVELSGSSSAPIRARSDWRFGAARLLSC
jgi:hypothetical protein